MDTASAPTSDPADAFLTDRLKANGSERANYQLFLTRLCTLLKPMAALLETLAALGRARAVDGGRFVA